MNKFLPQTGGHSLRLNEFQLMQNSYFEGFKALLQKFSSSGNLVIDGVNIDQSGVNVIYTSGYISINSEVLKVEADVFPKSSNPSDFLYFKPIETVLAPSPVTYEDTVSKNVHFQRKAILKYYNVSDTDGVALSSMSYPGSVIEGSIMPWYIPTGKLLTDYFNNTGLGINSAKGYAICNGLNNTLDLRGMTIAMATNVPFTGGSNPLRSILNGVTANAGTEGGNNLVTLNQTHIPSYTIPITISDPGHKHTFANSGDNLLDVAPNNHIIESNIDRTGHFDAGMENASTGITASATTAGGGLSHENRPATEYLFYIAKIRV